MENIQNKSDSLMSQSSANFFFNIFNKSSNSLKRGIKRVCEQMEIIAVKQPDLTNEDSLADLLPAPDSTRFHDLDFDCLAEICQYLDERAQFSLFKSSEIIANKMLLGIWNSYYKKGFNASKLETLPEAEQVDNLAIVLENFSKIENITLEVFQRYVERREFKELKHVKHISMHYHNWSHMVNKYSEYTEFRRFPCLEELHLSNIYIDFKGDKCILPLKALHLRNVFVMHDWKGDFLNSFFSKNLEELLILCTYTGFILAPFPQIAKCSNLKQLSLSIHHLYLPDTLSGVFKLKSLEVLTLEWSEHSYYFDENRRVFDAVFHKYFEDSTSAITEMIMCGTSEPIFESHRYLSHLKSLHWIGVNAYLAESGKLGILFMDFLQNNKALRHIAVDGVHFKGGPQFTFEQLVELCNSDREEWQKLDINFRKKESQIYRRKSIEMLRFNSVRFFIGRRDSHHRNIYESDV